MSQKLFKFGLLLGALSITACETNVPSVTSQDISNEVSGDSVSDTPSSVTSSSGVPTINSLKTALIALNQTKNYKCHVSENGKEYYSVIVNEKYVGTDSDEYDTALDVYIKDEKGIYSLNRNEGKLISSEYYQINSKENYTDLFDNSLVKTFYGVETEYVMSIADDAGSVTVNNKMYKLAMLDFLGFERSYLADLDSIQMTYRNNLTVKMDFGKNIYNLSFTNFGDAKSNTVESFLSKGGSVYVPDENLGAMKRLMKTDNFIRYTYDINEEDYNSLVEVFNPNYFYTTAGDLNSGNNISGYISLSRKEPFPDTTSPYYIPDLPTAYGIYVFLVSGNQYTFIPKAAAEFTDMAKFMHYPSTLKLLDKTQYFVSGKIPGFEKKYLSDTSCYYLKNQALITDFAKNMSLTEAYPLDTCTPIALGFEISLDKVDAGTAIVFHYVFKYQGASYDYLIPFSRFGQTNNETLDSFVHFYKD